MSYGFEIRNSSNEVVLDSSDTTFRVVHIEKNLAWNYTGTFTVSNFDSTKGSYYVYPIIDQYWFVDARRITTAPIQEKPTLSWNNTTKVMSVTSSGHSPTSLGNTGQYTIYYKMTGTYHLVFFEVE